MSQFLIVMLVQLLLVLLCVIGGLAFFNYRRRHEEDVGAQLLVYNINSHKDLRIDALTTLIEKAYGSQGEELKNIVDQLYMKEADCYRELIQLFMNRDPKQLTRMYDAVQKITAAYEGMLLQFKSEGKEPGLAKRAESVDKANFTSAQVVNPNLLANFSPSEPSGATAPVESAAMLAGKSAVTDASSNISPFASASAATDNAGLSVAAMEVQFAELKTEGTASLLAPQDDKTLASSVSQVSKDTNLQAISSDLLPAEQEMAYYQDKLMTYLESKEVSKGSVTELLNKDNQKEVAK